MIVTDAPSRDDIQFLDERIYEFNVAETGYVHADHRGHGLGRELMHAAETEARARGAFQMLLRTHSFQAPAFYEKLGFERVGAFDDYPRGHQDVLLRKTLGRV